MNHESDGSIDDDLVRMELSTDAIPSDHHNSRNPTFRFLVLGFALLFVTIWAWFRCLFCRIKGPDPLWIDETQLHLHRFAC